MLVGQQFGGQVAQVQSCLRGPCYILFLWHVWASKPEKTTETQKQSGHLGPQQYLKAGLSGFKTCPPSKIPNLPEEDSTNPLPSSEGLLVGFACWPLFRARGNTLCSQESSNPKYTSYCNQNGPVSSHPKWPEKTTMVLLPSHVSWHLRT